MDGQGSWENLAGGVVATVGPLVAAGLGSAADVPLWAPAALTAGTVTGLLIRDLRRPWSERAFRVAAGLAAGAWTTWSTVTGIWHTPNLAVGACAAVAAWLVAPAFAGQPEDGQPQPAASSVPGSGGRRAVWKRRIETQARVQPITILRDDDWPNGAGFDLEVAFAPESGDGWTQIDEAKFRIARAARLPKGCVLGVEEGDLQGTAVVRIPTVYAMADEVRMPEELVPGSVWDDHPIGVNEDTTLAQVNLRQSAGLIVGMRGSGKSNLLKVIIARLLACRDNLTWVVDLNGGGLAVPFMLPYANGETDTPPIDWIASTPAEAVAMAQVAAAIVKDRKARYAGLTAAAGGDLLPVTPDLPQITIVVDEGAEVENNPAARKAMDALQEVLRIGRADAVNVVFSGLRGTMDMMPVPVRKQTTLKICGIVEDDTELDYVLPGARVRSADLIHPGTMFMRRADRGKTVRQIKVYRATPDLLARIAVGTAPWRPQLDEPGRQIGGRVYAERMRRLQPWLDRLAGRPTTPSPDLDSPSHTPHHAVPAGRVQADEPTRRTPAAGTTLADEQGDEALSPAERAARRDQAREGLRRFVARERIREMPVDQLDDVFGSLVADLRPNPSQQDGDGWRPELLVDLARQAGPQGITPKGLKDALARRGIRVSDKTLFKHLSVMAAPGGPLRRRDGRYTTA